MTQKGEHTEKCCNILQHTATYCSMSARSRSTSPLQCVAVCYIVLQHVAAYISVCCSVHYVFDFPQKCGLAHCASSYHIHFQDSSPSLSKNSLTATYCNTLQQQHTATHWNTVQQQHTATHCNTVLHRHAADMIDSNCNCNTLQHTTTSCNTLQLPATHC